jgi:hypothetical protein
LKKSPLKGGKVLKNSAPRGPILLKIYIYYPGPPGSDLLLLRGIAGRTKDVLTMAFDMRYGFLLKWDPPI